MSNLLLLAAIAKKVKDDEKRASASIERRKNQLKNDEKAKRRVSYAEESFSPNYLYIDCVLKEILLEKERYEKGLVKDSDKISLISFCEEFEKTFDEISLEDAAPLLDKGEKIKYEINEEKAKQLELKEKLGDKFDAIESLGLRPDMLINEETPSCFRKKYNCLIENGKEDILLKEIKSLEQKIKYLPFNRNANKLLLTEKQNKIKEIQKAKLKAEEFEKLSTQDKKDILEYLQSKHTEFSKSQALDRVKYEISLSNNCLYFSREKGMQKDYKKLSERRERTLGRMLNEEKISDEDLEDIYRKLDKVGIKARRGEYNPDRLYYVGDKGRILEKYKKFMEWFINEVYEENEQFIERNTEIEEKEHND